MFSNIALRNISGSSILSTSDVGSFPCNCGSVAGSPVCRAAPATTAEEPEGASSVKHLPWGRWAGRDAGGVGGSNTTCIFQTRATDLCVGIALIASTMVRSLLGGLITDSGQRC